LSSSLLTWRAAAGRSQLRRINRIKAIIFDIGRISVMKYITTVALASTAVLFTSAASAQQGVDFSKVEIKTTDLGNKTYMLEGQGGDITVAVGTDGIIMVDTQFAPLHDKIKDAIAKISPLPIKYVINTHYHGDHIGGNAAFHKDGATIVAHDNVRIRLAAGTTNRMLKLARPTR
jgi:cyclase